VKKTLTIRPADPDAAPKLERKGRGWKISDSRLDTLHETARELRRSPTPAQTLLADAFMARDLGKYRPRRQVVIGSAIVDFACHPLKIVIEIEEEGVDPVIERRRDASLTQVGIKVLRFPAADVIADVDAVADAVVAEMKASWSERRKTRGPARPHRAYQAGTSRE
jgi:very-short-patch-repair endonuclease